MTIFAGKYLSLIYYSEQYHLNCFAEYIKTHRALATKTASKQRIATLPR
jgi:hypothetical protein